jgi:hypothetical protein
VTATSKLSDVINVFLPGQYEVNRRYYLCAEEKTNIVDSTISNTVHGYVLRITQHSI